MASITKRGKKWQVRYSKRRKIQVKQPDGTFKTEYKLEQVSKSGFNTKREAIEYSAKLELQAADGVNLKNDISFYDYFCQWYEQTKKPHLRVNTQYQYQAIAKMIYNFFGYTELKEIKRIDFQRFINQLDISTDYIKKITSYIRACIKYAIADKLLVDDFTILATINGDNSRKRKIDYLSLDEIKRLINYCKVNRKKDEVCYLVLLAIATGARIGELISLHWSDIDFEKQKITINKTYSFATRKDGLTKTQSSIRTIAINSEMLSLLKELQAKNTDRIFESKKGVIYTKYRISTHLQKIVRNADIKKQIVFHSLRHCHVAMLHSLGIDWYAISKRLGHKKLTTTLNIYAYLIDEEQAKADKLINDKLNDIF